MIIACLVFTGCIFACVFASVCEFSCPLVTVQVGYLCHLADPRGFTIELLQHTMGRREEPLVAQVRGGGREGEEQER